VYPLVENALRHGRGRVLLLAHRRDGWVELHVRDEGAANHHGGADAWLEIPNDERVSGRGGFPSR
jgi:LytS/YehU family sensor histidine kinase